jgi:hypothetical protein
MEGGCMLQINRNKLTLTPGGEKQVAYPCFLQLLLLQFPGQIGRGHASQFSQV